MYKFSHSLKFWIWVVVGVILISNLVYLNVEVKREQHQILTLVEQIRNKNSQNIPLSGKNSFQLSPQENCLSLKDASQHVGENQCVQGKLDHIYVSQKGTVFLSFCPNYQSCSFQAVIFASDAGKFSHLENLKGKIVQVSGLVKTYQGKAEIIINDLQQIKIK